MTNRDEIQRKHVKKIRHFKTAGPELENNFLIFIML